MDILGLIPGLDTIWTTVKWIVGIGGTVAIAVMVAGAFGVALPFVTTIAGIINNVLLPILKAVVEAIIEWLRILWEGFNYILGSRSGIVFVISMIGATVVYDNWRLEPEAPTKASCEGVVEALRTDYKMTLRTPAERKAYLLSKQKGK